ncbi:YggT family protein [Patescibacteria group bacterium]|nr:YggT family protein [Patescibacteria group bacterium]
MDFIIQTVNILADILIVFIFIRVIFSWFGLQPGWLTKVIFETTNPILKPIQKALPNTGMIDFSPMVAFFIIQLVRSLINHGL